MLRTRLSRTCLKVLLLIGLRMRSRFCGQTADVIYPGRESAKRRVIRLMDAPKGGSRGWGSQAARRVTFRLNEIDEPSVPA
jgi:hypothetical protein